LMIGLALVAGVTIFAAGLKHSVNSAIDKSVHAGVVVENKDGWSNIPAAAGKQIAALPGVSVASPIRISQAKVTGVGGTPDVSGLDPATLPAVYKIEWKRGNDGTLQSLDGKNAIVSDSWSKSKKKGVVDSNTLTTQN